MRNIELHKQRKHEWYLKNKEITNQRTKIRLASRRELSRVLFEAIKTPYSCSVCPEDSNICLDFHHLNPSEKEHNIADLKTLDYFGETLLKELNKCCVLCANCHRKLHNNELTQIQLDSLVKLEYKDLKKIFQSVKDNYQADRTKR